MEFGVLLTILGLLVAAFGCVTHEKKSNDPIGFLILLVGCVAIAFGGVYISDVYNGRQAVRSGAARYESFPDGSVKFVWKPGAEASQ